LTLEAAAAPLPGHENSQDAAASPPPQDLAQEQPSAGPVDWTAIKRAVRVLFGEGERVLNAAQQAEARQLVLECEAAMYHRASLEACCCDLR
jgi:hypothetical protein